MKKSLALIFAVCILCSACGTVSNSPTARPGAVSSTQAAIVPGALTNIPMQIGYGVSGSWFELYFTDPTDPAAKQESGGADQPLVASLDSARVSIDVAAYSFNLWDVESALIHARRRGIKVRLVMESDNMGGDVPKTLMAAGIPILGDGLPGLMHDKFVVIDHTEVWTGSMNFTESGTYQDNNNLMHLRSAEVAQLYEAEFNEMFVDHKFGPNVLSAAPHPSMMIDGTPLHIYFSPDNPVQSAVLDLLNNTRSSIYFLAYAFTAAPLAEAIQQRAAAGVKVSGVMESEQVNFNAGKVYAGFRKAGLDVHLDGNPGLMHHKVIIIDGRYVIFGSYNFTASAETKNDENLVVINNPEIAAQFTREFQRVYALAQP
jgi:phosphatidylserine/phosphatidylglycerophosphate/cardiolipin synthase-like enzyme